MKAGQQVSWCGIHRNSCCRVCDPGADKPHLGVRDLNSRVRSPVRGLHYWLLHSNLQSTYLCISVLLARRYKVRNRCEIVIHLPPVNESGLTRLRSAPRSVLGLYAHSKTCSTCQSSTQRPLLPLESISFNTNIIIINIWKEMRSSDSLLHTRYDRTRPCLSILFSYLWPCPWPYICYESYDVTLTFGGYHIGPYC